MRDVSIVIPLDDPAADLARAGGKGASLARLAAAGLPVPEGFCVTTDAYRLAVAGREAEIRAALAGVDPSRPGTSEAAAARIVPLFATVPDDAAEEIVAAYRRLGGGPVAVRSSATAEDLPDLSFAGQQESYLDVEGVPALLDAVRRCWASLWNARAIAYRARAGVAGDDVALAVVVQRMVDADASGILFTADPVTGARDRVVVNAGWGLGEAVVGGRVTPDTVVVAGDVEMRVADKALMTVRTGNGTAEVPVPEERRRAPVLDEAEARELAAIGARAEELDGVPVDVEWARTNGRLIVLQARPITTLRETWNDSLAGDFLWTAANVGEAVPDVMTPCTWSVVKIFLAESLPLPAVAGFGLTGNVGGRLYLNMSVMLAVADALFVGRRAREGIVQVFGGVPDELLVPRLPVGRWTVIRSVLPRIVRARRRFAAGRREFPTVVARTPARCAALRDRIATADAPALTALWRDELEPFLRSASSLLGAVARGDNGRLALSGTLARQVGEDDAALLMTGARPGGGALDSLGPVLGLARLARDEIDRDTYVARWGHRGPHELELSLPRPAEDPGWLDRELAALGESHTDGLALVERRDAARAGAWQRIERADPRTAARLRRSLDGWARLAGARELARSEVVRVFWVLRDWVLRAGAVTGHGEDLFLLAVDEILAVLAVVAAGAGRGGSAAAPGPAGDAGTAARTALAAVPARQAAHAHYAALPPYPTWIRGRFDPDRWAADPDRRSDLVDCTAGAADRVGGDAAGVVTGFPGAAGVVEGTARVLARAEEGDALRPGEILVTTATNVGWTPLFPRAGAVVTDVGAPLSHAAIVARELGVPAVVGCGDATRRLHTGDRLRVDGARGTVELLGRAR
ncbi:MAG: PEP/pyruvate-binding domain-containing protein [Pseudonocardia sp.]